MARVWHEEGKVNARLGKKRKKAKKHRRHEKNGTRRRGIVYNEKANAQIKAGLGRKERDDECGVEETRR